MRRPASPGPPSPVSSSSTGSLVLTPPSTIEPMKRVRVLALLKDRDLEGDPLINEVRELLRKENQTVCLQLAWQRRSARPKANSFLHWVFALPKLDAVRKRERLKVTDLRIVCARSGPEWRRRSEESSTRPLSGAAIREILKIPEIQWLDQVPWGEMYFREKGQMSPYSEWQAEMGTELQLILHHDYLVLAEIPAQPVERTPADFREDKLQCALCGVILACEKDFEEPCLFHPGRKQVPSIPDDDTEEFSDDETEGSSTSSQSDADNGTDDDGSIISDCSEYIYLCCNRRASEPGCVVEATHLSFFEVNPFQQWKSDWAQPEAGYESPPLSED